MDGNLRNGKGYPPVDKKKKQKNNKLLHVLAVIFNLLSHFNKETCAMIHKQNNCKNQASLNA
jgi:hypothetical protein